MAASSYWSRWREETGRPRGVSHKMTKEQRLWWRGSQPQESTVALAEPVVAESLSVCSEGLWSEEMNDASAPNASGAGWSRCSGQKRGSSKKMTKQQRLAKRSTQAREAVVDSSVPVLAGSSFTRGSRSMSERVCDDSASNEAALPENTVLQGGQELSNDASVVKSRNARECERVFLYDMLKECIDAHRFQIAAEIERTYARCLQHERTQVHITHFLETVGFNWQCRGRQCDDSYNVLMLELFPRSVRVLEFQLAPGMFVSESLFVSELDDAWCMIRGVPQPSRSIPIDETVHGTVQCYIQTKKSCKLGVIDYAPSPAFPTQLRTVKFLTQDSNDIPPIGARVRFNIRSVYRDVWNDDVQGWVQCEVKQAFNVCVRHELGS